MVRLWISVLAFNTALARAVDRSKKFSFKGVGVECARLVRGFERAHEHGRERDKIDVRNEACRKYTSEITVRAINERWKSIVYLTTNVSRSRFPRDLVHFLYVNEKCVDTCTKT